MTVSPTDFPIVQSACATRYQPAVNFGGRRGCDAPDMIILHYTGMGSAKGALDWLCCEESGVSCHYFVFEDGETVQLVVEEKRAHHAGVSFWKGDADINSRSIGIEIANAGHGVPAGEPLPDFPAVQMEAVANLCRDLIDRYDIPAHHVLAHSDVAPNRKTDPGEAFDWGWLAGQGVGHYVDPAPVASGRFFQQGDRGEPVEALQSMLALYGYDVEISGDFDDKTRVAVTAFQRHFRRERVDGIADISTIDTLHRLLMTLPEAP